MANKIFLHKDCDIWSQKQIVKDKISNNKTLFKFFLKTRR